LTIASGFKGCHSACLELLETHPGPLTLLTLVITEVAYLIGTRLGWEAEVRFLGDLASGSFAIDPLHASDPISPSSSPNTATSRSAPSMPQ
jgi:hypothetical protein